MVCSGEEDRTYESNSPIWVSILSRLTLNYSELILDMVLKDKMRVG